MATTPVIKYTDPTAPLGSSERTNELLAQGNQMLQSLGQKPTSLPKIQPPAVVSSSKARREITKANTQFNAELQKNGLQHPNQQTTNKTANQENTQNTQENQGKAALNQQSKTQIAKAPKSDFDRLMSTMTDRYNSMSSDLANFTKQANSVRNKLQSANASLIDSITNSFASQIEETKKVNEATIKGVTQAGIRAGRDRYTMETEDMNLANEMREGVSRISDLAARRDTLIAQTQLAQTQEDWKMFYETWKQSQGMAAELNKTVMDMYQVRMANEKAAQDKVRNTLELEKLTQDISSKKVEAFAPYLAKFMTFEDPKTDEALVSAIASAHGIDPQMLIGEVSKYQDEQNQKNSTEAIRNLTFINQDRRAAGQKPLTLDEYQRQERNRVAVTDDAEGNPIFYNTVPGGGGAAGGATIIGGGARSGGAIAGTGAPSKAIPAATGAALQDAYAFLSGRFTKDEAARNGKYFKGLLAQGKTETAKQFLQTQAIANLPATEQTKAFGRVQAVESLTRLTRNLSAYQAKGGNTGLLAGSVEGIAQRVGHTSNPELARLGNDIQLAIIAYRNAVSGAAFTESELKQYNQVFPSIGKVKELNDAKIGSLVETFTANNRSVMESILGPGNYGQIFGSSSAGSVAGASNSQPKGTKGDPLNVR